ncbi:MAG TPA: nuclear transport factor 2 family protein [Solirubrobacteraceae bacterium]|nr:nuclear transport factor 2 family protein [Solirubrobacteraceae bacterium]
MFLAINRADEEAFLDLLADDVEWVSAASGILPPDVWRGREAVREGRRRAAQEGRHVHTTLQEIRTSEHRALVRGVVTSDFAERHRAITLPMSWIVQVRDGRVAAIRSFTNRAAARLAWEDGGS